MIGRPRSTQGSSSVSISPVLLAQVSRQSIHIPLKLGDQAVEVKALLDSGAGGKSIHPKFVIRHRLITKKLLKPIKVYNVDNSPNIQGTITKEVILPVQFGDQYRTIRFYVAGIGSEDVILGLPWLQEENPDHIDWKTGKIMLRKRATWQTVRQKQRQRLNIQNAAHPVTIETIAELPDIMERLPVDSPHILIAVKEEEPQEIIAPTTEDAPATGLFIATAVTSFEGSTDHIPGDIWNQVGDDEVLVAYLRGGSTTTIFGKQEESLTMDETRKQTRTSFIKPIGRVRRTPSRRYIPVGHFFVRATQATELAQAAHAKDKPKRFEEMVPSYLHDYRTVFDKGTAERLPEHCEWDHEIHLKLDFNKFDAKVYPLNTRQKTELDKFLEENLRKGYIRPSKSEMVSPFFFVGKKDRSLRPCQDYRTLNDNTIKDRYPLLLISDLVDKLKGAKVFTKMDLRAGYNNIRIKQGDEHKAAFKVPGGLYEPTVMFFGLCNSPATFQRMMDTVFKDMIDEGWIVIYMDDILIFSKDQKTHQERTRRVLQ